MTDERPASYMECLKMGWLVAWRFTVALMVLGIVFGFLMGLGGALLGVDNRLVMKIALAGTVPLVVFGGFPLVVRMLVRKRFEGFRLRIERDAEKSPAHLAEPFGGDLGRDG